MALVEMELVCVLPSEVRLLNFQSHLADQAWLRHLIYWRQLQGRFSQERMQPCYQNLFPKMGKI